MAADISQILANAQSPDAAARAPAETQLRQFQEQNYGAFLIALGNELASNDKPEANRQLAGVLLKNALDAPDAAKKAALVQQWTSLDAGARQQVKHMLMATLGAQANLARSAAAQVVAKVAAIELPLRSWQEAIPALQSNMQQDSSELKQATLEALGYVCEEMAAIQETVLDQDAVNGILTAIAQGMTQKESGVRLAATRALHNAVEFASSNFEKDAERDYIMQSDCCHISLLGLEADTQKHVHCPNLLQRVCDTAIDPDMRTRQAAFECLTHIVEEYYDQMLRYIQDIFRLTQRAVAQDEEDVATMAVEVWSSIAEEEEYRQDELDRSAPGATPVIHHKFAEQALPHLAPLLLGQLTKQEEDQDLDAAAWNLAMACGTCLGLIAQAVRDPIVQHTMGFVQENIGKRQGEESWRQREAAVFALGCIMQGPRYDALADVARSALPFLLQSLRDDPKPQVRSTVAWTIGRIFEYVVACEPDDVQQQGRSLITPQSLPEIVQTLLHRMDDEVYIAARICDALGFLAVGIKYVGQASLLSPYFKDTVSKLLGAGERALHTQDPSQMARLQLAAFEGISEWVRATTADTLELVSQLIPLLLGKVDVALRVQPVSEQQRQQQMELQEMLCGVLQVIIQRLTDDDSAKAAVLQHADSIMHTLLQVLSLATGATQEQAMRTVGALAHACGQQFVKYMQAFFPVMELLLRKHEDWEVCNEAVGTLGSVAQAIDAQVQPFCDGVMQVLLLNLQNPAVHRNLKPHILSVFGDLSLALGDAFEPYLNHVLPVLDAAQKLCVDQQSADDLADYNRQLRDGILAAYVGMFGGFSSGKATTLLGPSAQGLLTFMEAVSEGMANASEPAAMKDALGLLGDLARLVPGVGSHLDHQPYVKALLHSAAEDEDETVRAASQYADSQIKIAAGAHSG